VEAHRSYERFEHGHRVATGGEHAEPHYGRNAAIVVAVMAALLAYRDQGPTQMDKS
jgi:hypothetical protein